MCEHGARLGVIIGLALVVVGGCAPAMSPLAPSDAGTRQPAAEGPTNFASPQDIIQRYPSMRRQQL